MTAPVDDAFAFLDHMLQEWGLGELSSFVKGLLTDGVTKEVIPLKLRETDVYKKRFSALAERQTKGLAPITEAEFIATESSLKTVVRRFLGAGTYDTREFTDKWISSDTSPQELTDRMNTWAERFDTKDEQYKQWWYSHGLTRADAIRSVMDPSVNDTTLKRRFGAFGIGAEAFRAYGPERFENVYDEGRFGAYADAGVSDEQARQGFSRVAAREERDSFLANLSGKTLTEEEQEREELLGDEQAAAKRRGIYAEEEARFSENYQGGERAFSRGRSGSY